MSDDWQTFICSMGDNLASIMVDVGVAKTIKGALPDVAILSLIYKQPNESGFPTDSEFDAARAIEKQLKDFVAFGRDAYVGRITKGRREDLCVPVSRRRDPDGAAQFLHLCAAPESRGVRRRIRWLGNARGAVGRQTRGLMFQS